MKAYQRLTGKPVIDLIEEAFVVLRTCPPPILAWYLAGSVPFAAGVLVFCSEMAGNPDAASLLPAASVGLTLLYFWMTWALARFSSALLAHLRGSPAQSWSLRRNLSLAARQAILQSTAPVAIPLSSLTLVGFGPMCAFYQTAATLDDGRSSSRDLVRAGAAQALLWPGQCIGMFSLLSVFSLIVFINWLTLIAAGPILLKMVTGIESVFTRSPWSMINSTFFSAVLVLTFLTVEPLSRTCTVLRCFYGLSITTGEDIRARLRRGGFRVLTLLAAGWLILSTPTLQADEPTPSTSAEQLDAVIREVIEQDKYRWRRGREAENTPEEKVTWIRKFQDWVKNLQNRIRRVWRQFLEWLYPETGAETGLQGLVVTFNRLLIYLLLTLAALILVISMTRVLRNRHRGVLFSTSTDSLAIPDLNHEDTTPDAVPEDEWIRWGRRLLEQGELRLALRAFYLASLAQLAGRGLVTISRGKTNREYARELERRGRALPGLPGLFGENVRTFERIWYGRQQADADLVVSFLARVEQMKTAA